VVSELVAVGQADQNGLRLLLLLPNPINLWWARMYQCSRSTIITYHVIYICPTITCCDLL
jgi:hypothetical protein